MTRSQPYVIRPLSDTESDRRAQLAFLAEACPDNALIQDPARLRWQYVDNPAARGRPTVWLLTGVSRILGQLSTIPVAVSAPEHSYAAAWCVDFVVHPAFRNRGIGPLLLRDVATRFDFLMGLGTNELSSVLFQKAGWSDLGSLPHYIKILDARAVLARRLPAMMCRMVAPPVNLVLRRAWRVRRSDQREIRIVPITAFGAEFDALWDRVSPHYGFAVRRDQAYLSWKYVTQPRTRYVGFRAERQGRLRGYVVVRKARDPYVLYGMVVDLVAEPDDAATLDALLQTAVDHLRREGATYVRCDASQERTRAALRRLGFVERPSCIRFMVSALPGQARRSGDGHGLDHWCLMCGDGDVDRLPMPEDG